MHLLRELMENKLHGGKTRGSGQNRLDSWSVTDVLVTAKDYSRQDHSSSELEMWANAQRDGRPAEYRWRPLFNATKFG